MHPIYFGKSENPLFGVYYFPQTSSVQDEGVVLCYPFGQEYLWMHRAYRLLSVLFAKAGLHVLRFDYFGCGDSSGEFEDVDINRWVSDLGAAIDEIKDSGGVSKVSLVGFRLGATLAALATTGRKDIAKIVLWDPVVNGKQYVEDLEASHHDWCLNNLPKAGDSDNNNGKATTGARTDLEVVGFPIMPRLLQSLEGIDLLSLSKMTVEQIFIFDSLEFRRNTRLQDHFESLRLNVEYQFISGSKNWSQAGSTDALSVPDQILQFIVSSTTGGGS